MDGMDVGTMNAQITVVTSDTINPETMEVTRDSPSIIEAGYLGGCRD